MCRTHSTQRRSLTSLLQRQYLSYHAINWGNDLSEQQCWTGDNVVTLMDVDVENDSVVKVYYDWMGPLSKNMALTVCVSAPSGIARIAGNSSRELPEFSASGNALGMTLQLHPRGKDPSTLFRTSHFAKASSARLLFRVPKISQPWKQ